VDFAALRFSHRTAWRALPSAENFENLPKPYRSYREGLLSYPQREAGPRPLPASFMQFDADTVGPQPRPRRMPKCAMMAADTMESAGAFPRGKLCGEGE